MSATHVPATIAIPWCNMGVNDGLRLAFAGTPQLAATILSTLGSQNGHDLLFVITQPDRPAGRGRMLVKSPVKQVAERYGLEIRQPVTPDDIDTDNRLAQADLLVVAAFGMILPADILHRPRLGCINVHTSLLPRWRGAAPIQRAIQAGDSYTGVTIMQIDEGKLHDKLADLGGKCLLEALDRLAENKLSPRKQDGALTTYANKISKDEALIDWHTGAVDLERTVRAFNPVPVVHTVLQGTSMRIWEADVIKPETDNRRPGRIIDISADGIVVATAHDALRIRRLQLPGKKITSARDFLNGHPGLLKAELT